MVALALSTPFNILLGLLSVLLYVQAMMLFERRERLAAGTSILLGIVVYPMLTIFLMALGKSLFRN